MKDLSLIRWMVVMAAALLTGCASIGDASTASLHQKCDEQQEKGCVEMRTLNLAWNESEAKLGGLLYGLDQQYIDERERERRAWDLPNELWFKGVREGRLAAGKPKSFVVYLYGLNRPDMTLFGAYRVNLDRTADEGHTVMKTRLERVITGPVPQFDPRFNLGQPDMVIRIRAEGVGSVGASFQIPWTMVTDRTHILVCPEDEAAYPPPILGATKQGLWHLPSPLGYLKSKQSTRILSVMLFKD